MIPWLLGAALAAAVEPVWERDIIGVELLVIQPTLKRVLFLEKRPDVRWPAPIEGAIGHSMLRLVEDTAPTDQWVVGVYADMDVDGDGVDDPSNLFRGLFGGYDNVFVTKPLSDLADDYAFQQSRWIRRYPIPMSEDEIVALKLAMQRAATASDARELSRYRFFTENCTTELAELLNEALFGKAREFNYPMTLPRKYRRRGRLAPLAGTVTPHGAVANVFDEDWALPVALARLCAEGDGACADEWIAAAQRELGTEWIQDLAQSIRRKRRYRELWSSELRAAIVAVDRDAARR